MPSYRTMRVADELHYAELWIWQRPGVDPHRIGYEFLSMMRDGQPPPEWKKTWPEILRVEKAGAHPQPASGPRRVES
jgi:hypothetical protein